uniref:Uncharacterized protein n=1 Tax=Cyclophora tenuis TaxID=216820 RepID=A0A7S1GIQ8_CYCTE
MDGATSEQKRLRNFQKKLLAKAVPLNDAAKQGRFLEQGGNNNGDAWNATLDLREYALKYVGCQNVKSFSDDLAQDEDSATVLGMNRFVMFRFCRADICSNYNKYGCQYDFGEYVIEMEYYLEAMATYHYDRYAEYCATCLECMTPTADDDTLVFNNYTDDLVVEANVTNGNETVWSAQRDCLYYEACYNYKEACQPYMSKATQYEDFFTCSEFEVGNNVGYLGPHCAKDGKTIQIGIFEDQNCEAYIGDVVDLEQFTGMTFDDYGLSFYDSGDCISCISGDEYDLYTDDAAGQSVYELCEFLYDASGKCNRYYDVYDVDETYETYQQADNEGKVCDFIESLVENNYNQYGEIILEDTFDFNNWKDYHEYEKLVPTEVTLWQTIGLISSITLMLFLMVYSCYLYSKLRNPRWDPNSSKYGTAAEAGKISRVNSGIMLGRSNSDPSAALA